MNFIETITPLIGDVSVQIVWDPDSCSLEFAIETARADQEAMCGYPLKLKSHTDIQVKGGHEIFTTFTPAAGAPPAGETA